MKKLFALITLAVVLIFTASSCGRNRERVKPEVANYEKIVEHVEEQHQEPFIEGPITKLVQSFENAKFLSKCDRKNLPKMLEIANALDEKAPEIDAYNKTAQKDQRYNYVQAGPLVIRELKDPPTPKTGWQEDIVGWSELNEIYEQTLKDPSIENWNKLNRRVKGNLLDDEERILNDFAYFIDHDAEDKLIDVIYKHKECSLNPECLFVALDEKTMSWLKKDEKFRHNFEEMAKATNKEDAQSFINANATNAKAWYAAYFVNRKKESVRREGSNFILPIYTEVFSGITDTLSKYIEHVWKNADLSLKIEWHSKPHALFFTLLQINEYGGRPYVLSSAHTKEIHFYKDITARAIPHEIGHVLGLRDNYFTVWDDSICAYRIQYREDDLMSDDLGSVLPEDWKWLEETYTLNPQ